MTPSKGSPAAIRLARLDDAAAISEVHRSHVPRWYRQIGEEQHEVSYDALTLDERCGFGGPWAATETCAIHLNNMLMQRHVPVVAEDRGEVVAEMELFVGREGPAYGRNCHIGLLYVHRDAQGRGIGRAMVERAVWHAEEERCDTLTVASTAACEEFYRKCGFSFHDTLLEMETLSGEYLVDMATLPAPASAQSFSWGMDMKLGRLQSSAYHIFEMTDICALPSMAECNRINAFWDVNGHPSLLSYVCRPSGKAEVGAWSVDADVGDLAFAALRDLSYREIRSASLLLPRKDYERVAELVDARLIGYRHTLMMNLRR
jgi:GNAT superfamily N-acetyltransferase